MWKIRFVVLLTGLVVLLAACHFFNENPVVTFHNTSDTRLCFGSPSFGSPSCEAKIKARGESHWAVDSCFQGHTGWVGIYTESGQQIYSRSARCEEWGDNAFVVINWRDGAFVVADSINGPTPSPP